MSTGTGKTRVVIAAARSIVHDLNGKVLVVTPSNAAADVVIQRCGLDRARMFRLCPFQLPAEQELHCHMPAMLPPTLPTLLPSIVRGCCPLLHLPASDASRK